MFEDYINDRVLNGFGNIPSLISGFVWANGTKQTHILFLFSNTPPIRLGDGDNSRYEEA